MVLIYIAGFVICFAVASLIYRASASFAMKRRRNFSVIKHDEGISGVAKAPLPFVIGVKQAQTRFSTVSARGAAPARRWQHRAG